MHRSTFGVETSLMSLLWFLTQVRAAGGVQKLLEATEGTAQEFTLEEGAGEPSAVTSGPMSPTVHSEGPYTHRGYRLDVKRNLPQSGQFVRTLSKNRVLKF